MAAALALQLTAAGCVLTFDSTALGVPVSMASAASRPAVGDTFTVRSRAVFLFWGMVSAKEPSLESMLETQLAGGRSVRDLRIRVSHRWSDILFTVLTAGIVSPETVTFVGIVGPPSP